MAAAICFQTSLICLIVLEMFLGFYVKSKHDNSYYRLKDPKTKSRCSRCYSDTPPQTAKDVWPGAAETFVSFSFVQLATAAPVLSTG